MLHNLLHTMAHEIFASLQVVGILVYFAWVRSLTMTQILSIPAEYPCQYWHTVLMPYIHVHQVLGNLSSVITVWKLLCLVVMRRISHVVIDYEYIFLKIDYEYIFLKIRNMLTYMSVLQKLLDEVCRTECLATPFARLDTPWFTLVGIYEGVSVWEGITYTDILLWDTLNLLLSYRTFTKYVRSNS